MLYPIVMLHLVAMPQFKNAYCPYCNITQKVRQGCFLPSPNDTTMLRWGQVDSLAQPASPFSAPQRPQREGRQNEKITEKARAGLDIGEVGQHETKKRLKEERQKRRRRRRRVSCRRCRQSMVREWRVESRLHWPQQPRAFSPGSVCIWREDNGKTSREFSNENQIGWQSVSPRLSFPPCPITTRFS